MYVTRPATSEDYEFLFELKKAAEYDLIHHVFGWNESTQRDMHNEEWEEAKPNIIEIDSKAVGSFLLQDKGNVLYLCRFFLLPEFHGSGIGSKVLSECLSWADKQKKNVTLCHLQGSKVARLYERFGFTIEDSDQQFVYMKRVQVK